MAVHVSLRRTARVPDELRVARCRRAPELGPRILFFSGGSALREVSMLLKLYTHNSIHLVTPFDSGGSSAELREAFGMLSVGDLRNRMLALADNGVRGTPELRDLFSHRMGDASEEDLLQTLEQMVYGEHPLMTAVPQPLRQIVCTYLRFLVDRLPVNFQLKGASLGNLVLAGGFLSHGRDIESVLYLFSKLVEVRGTVRPVTTGNAHLAAILEDGTRLVGQHRLTGKGEPEIQSPIRELSLVDSLGTALPVSIEAPAETRRQIRTAELVCFPMGSFYSSLMANLLPRGVGRAIASAECPKIYVPSMGRDPEQLGMTLGASVQAIIDRVRRDAGEDTATERILNWVLVDCSAGDYAMPMDLERVKELGVEVIDASLVAPKRQTEQTEGEPPRSEASSEMQSAAHNEIDAQRLCEILLSLV